MRETRHSMPRDQAQFDILGETPDLLAVDKPAGLLVHPTKPGGPRTLWDGLGELLAFELINGGGVSIINRLDRETSGVVLVAKNASAARQCSMAMQRGGIRKRYLAIVWGWPDPEEFEVSEPILRVGEVAPSAIWLKRGIHPLGAPSRTKFRVAGRYMHPRAGRIALVEAEPLTGRTHQIRVHLAHSGTPVVGDKIYGPDENWYLRFMEEGWTGAMAGALHLRRHALHSTELALDFSGHPYRWTSPLPGDLSDFLAGASRL